MFRWTFRDFVIYNTQGRLLFV